MLSFSLRQLLRLSGKETTASGGQYIEIVPDNGHYVVVKKEQKASYIKGEVANLPYLDGVEEVEIPSACLETAIREDSTDIEHAVAIEAVEPSSEVIENALRVKLEVIRLKIVAWLIQWLTPDPENSKTQSKSILSEALKAVLVFAAIVVVMIMVL